MILGAGKSGFVMSKVNFGEVLNEVWYIMLYIHASSSLITLALGPFLLSRFFYIPLSYNNFWKIKRLRHNI